MSAESSRALLHRARQGEREALDELFARYVPFLRRIGHGRLPRWARTAAETADVVQDTLLQTFRRLDQFEPRGNGAMRAYLRQALHNRIRNAHRDVGRRPLEAPIDDVDVACPTASPLDQFLADEDRARYRRALATLRPDEREAIIGRFELGYSYEQLSAALDKPSPDAARVAVRRAVVRLAEAIEP